MKLCIHCLCSELKLHWTQNQEKFVMAMAHFVHSLDDDDGDVDQNDDDINDDDGDCTNVMIVHWTLWCVSNPIFSVKSFWHSSQLLTRSCSDLPKRQMFMDAKFKIGEEHWKYSAWSWTLILHPWSWFLTHEISGSTWEQQDLTFLSNLDPYPWPRRSLEILEDGDNQELLNEQLRVKNGDVSRPEQSQLTWCHNHTHPHYHHSSSS